MKSKPVSKDPCPAVPWMAILLCFPKLCVRTDFTEWWVNMHQKCHTSFTLPEGEKDDRLDDTELQHRIVSTQQLPCGKVEEEQSVQRQTDGDVVDDGDVQISTCRPVHTKSNHYLCTGSLVHMCTAFTLKDELLVVSCTSSKRKLNVMCVSVCAE